MRNPLVAAIALAVLLMTASKIPLARLVPPQGHVNFTGHTGVMVAQEIYLVRTGTGFEVIDSEVLSWDRLSRLITDRPQDVMMAHFESTVALRGYPFPMWVSGDRFIALEGMPNGPGMPGQTFRTRPRWTFASTELAQARAAYVEYAAKLNTQFAGELDPTKAHVFYALPLNVLLNVASLVLFALFMFSVAGAPRYMRYYKTVSLARRGICGICRYDLKAIDLTPEGKRCPECGTLWPASILAR